MPKGYIIGEIEIANAEGYDRYRSQSPALIAMEERVKATFDPQGILNPGKIFPGTTTRGHGAC